MEYDWRMAKRRKLDEHVPALVHDDYAALLRSEAENVPRADLEEASNRDRQTLWRAASENAKERTVGAAFAFRHALEQVRQVELPPPVVSIRDRSDYEWHSLGMQLKDMDSHAFAEALETIRNTVKSIEGFQRLTKLSDPSTSEAVSTSSSWRETRGKR